MKNQELMNELGKEQENQRIRKEDELGTSHSGNQNNNFDEEKSQKNPNKKNDSAVKTFESLKVWKKAQDLREKVSQFCEALPKDETYKWKDQLLRASRGITNQIAEGYGRFHFQENIQFCRQARGSLFETLDHLIIANDENYLSDKTFNVFRNEIDELVPLLNGYIAYLQEQQEKENE